MDNQQIFNFVVAIAAFLAVFVFNQTTRKIQKLEDETAAMRERMLQDYVQKDDYKADIKEIKDILRQIFDKLDSKQDKWASVLFTFILLAASVQAEYRCVRWGWTGDVYNRKVYCLKWEKVERKWLIRWQP